jgi:hypothetical protein
MVPTERGDGGSFPLSSEPGQNAARRCQHGNWSTYAAAAGAALAMATNASADIVLERYGGRYGIGPSRL